MAESTVLVTGGAGYVGSHVCLALSEAGSRPVVYDNFSRGHRWAVRFGPVEEGELADGRRLADAFARHRPVAVLHLAALTYVGESMAEPALYYRNNVAGTLTLLEAMRAAGVGPIVFSSTAAVYGTPRTMPIPETAPLDPVNPYGASKLMAERLLADFVRAYSFRAAALRYFNAAGADPKARIGEDHRPETHLVPLALDAAAGRRAAISVFGEDYPTADGTCVRDYIHVLDLAEAHVRTLSRLIAAEEPRFLAFNLGTGAGASVREVIDAAQRIVGRPIARERAPRRDGDPPVLVADPSRAMAELGWRPTRAGLDDQIGDAWRWHRAHFAQNDRAE
jgi:UDP-arabinose 4-epimerase